MMTDFEGGLDLPQANLKWPKPVSTKRSIINRILAPFERQLFSSSA